MTSLFDTYLYDLDLELDLAVERQPVNYGLGIYTPGTAPESYELHDQAPVVLQEILAPPVPQQLLSPQSPFFAYDKQNFGYSQSSPIHSPSHSSPYGQVAQSYGHMPYVPVSPLDSVLSTPMPTLPALPKEKSLRVRKRSGESNKRKSAIDGFVNFTCHDSRTIMSGVAPSGNCRTKERRRRELEQQQAQLLQTQVDTPKSDYY